LIKLKDSLESVLLRDANASQSLVDCVRGLARTPVAECSVIVMPDSIGATSKPAAIASYDRIDAIDALRGMALFGVLVVNLVTEFRVSIFQQLLPRTTQPSDWNRLTEAFISFAFEAKAFAIFSILFGVGLAMQFERLSASGRRFYFLTRRLLALLGLGLLHLVFIWNGDILTEYALAGLLILPLLRLPGAMIVVPAIALLALFSIRADLPPPLGWPDTAVLVNHVVAANHVYATGTFLEVWRFSVRELAFMLPLHISVFPRTLALMLMGVLVWRCGVLKNPAAYRVRLLLAVAISITAGMILTAGDAFDVFGRWGLSGSILQSFAPVVLATGYCALAIWVAQHRRATAMLTPFVAIGRMAFSNYIMQSVIFGIIFFGYGFGLFGSVGAGPALLLGIVVYCIQAAVSMLWLARFRYGPIEWLWRALMYGRLPPMRSNVVD
jgi:uncharacterized protein